MQKLTVESVAISLATGKGVASAVAASVVMARRIVVGVGNIISTGVDVGNW